MLKGHVFKFQTFANEAFAHFINTFLQGNMGITKGCNLSKTSNSVTISAGYFCVMGRFLEIVGNETISDITNTGYYQLICEIDLSQTNTTSELNQASIKLVRNANAYSNLTKEDLFNGGSLYQYEFARFKVTEQGIVDFTDKRTFLNLSSLYSQINSNFNSLFNAKDQEAEALLEEIRQELASVLDGSIYLLKEGGTMSGDINMQSNAIKFGASGTIEFKENGYGDKFRFRPYFAGADDNNILKIQGAVGEAGTDPEYTDLGYITAKSGHVNLIGQISTNTGVLVYRDSGETCVTAHRSDTGTEVKLSVGNGGINHGVWSSKLNKWIVVADNSDIYLNGNAETASKLCSAKKINGTNFDGSAEITTSKWGTARTLALSGAVSGSASVDGSGNVTINTTQANIAVLTGTQTLTANTSENLQNNIPLQTTWKLNFPSGYNMNNCVCIAFGAKFYDDVGYNYGLNPTVTGANLSGAVYKSITLGAKNDTSKISCEAWNWSTSARSFMYKIVLMKIS